MMQDVAPFASVRLRARFRARARFTLCQSTPLFLLANILAPYVKVKPGPGAL